MQKAVFAALLATIPSVAFAEPATVMTVPRSEHFVQRLYVHTGGSVDIALPPGEALAAPPTSADPRWSMTTYTSSDTVHIVLKAAGEMPNPQLITIPASKKPVHLIVRSGSGQSSAYTVYFVEPQPHAASARGVASATRPAVSAPSPSPDNVVVTSCAAPLDTRYRISGDKRIDVRAMCDDGKHTYILVGEGRDRPDVVPYRVDVAGHQDQIANATFAASDATHPSQWVIDGVADHWALLADSSRGQIRKILDHE